MSRGPLQTNARLTAVTSATAATGGREDWDQAEGTEPAGAGAGKWTGDEPAYYREAVEKIPQGADVLVRRTLWLQTTTAREIGIDTDDVLTFVDPGGTTRTATAVAIAYSDASAAPAAGQPAGPALVSARLQTTRIELTPA